MMPSNKQHDGYTPEDAVQSAVQNWYDTPLSEREKWSVEYAIFCIEGLFPYPGPTKGFMRECERIARTRNP